MGKYFITGRQGSGKTTVITCLQGRGYNAYNTDELSEATKLQDKMTGQIIDWPAGNVDWKKYVWNWQKTEIERLLTSAEDVFLGAVISNQQDFYTIFDRVFVFTVDAETLRQRLQTHEYEGHHAIEKIERLLTDHDNKQSSFIDEGAEPVDGNRPAKEIVDDTLNRIALINL